MTTLYGTLFGLACALYGYLLGSIPNAVLIAKQRDIDITKVGSGNPGGTNVWRILGWKAGVLCMFLDCLKGFVATFPLVLIILLVPAMQDSTVFPPLNFTGHDHLNIYACLGGLFAALGHSFPLFYHFRGGKNVMVTFGFAFATSPIIAFICLVIFIGTLYVTRRVAFGSIAGGTATFVLGLIPLLMVAYNVAGYQYFGWYFNATTFFLCDWVYYLFLISMGGFLVVRHRKNIEDFAAHKSKADF